MSQDFFPDVEGRIQFGGIRSDSPLAYKVYQPDRMVLGKRMEDQLKADNRSVAIFLGGLFIGLGILLGSAVK